MFFHVFELTDAYFLIILMRLVECQYDFDQISYNSEFPNPQWPWQNWLVSIIDQEMSQSQTADPSFYNVW